MVLFRITENEPSKMHNVRPYVYSRPCLNVDSIKRTIGLSIEKSRQGVLIKIAKGSQCYCVENIWLLYAHNPVLSCIIHRFNKVSVYVVNLRIN